MAIRKFSSSALKLNNSNGIRKFSSSAILNSSTSSVLDRILSELRNENINLNSLQMVKYENKIGESSAKDSISETTSFGESFPWLMGENGKPIDFNKSVDLVEGVNLVNTFLAEKYKVDPNSISNVKISKLLEQFNGPNVTILELYNHVSDIFNKDKTNFVEGLTSNNGVELVNSLGLFKPFTTYGDITINDLGIKLLNLNWSKVTDNLSITVHALPAAVNFISYSLILRGFMKHVHNRPFDKAYTELQKKQRDAINNRRKHLLFFATFGIPITMILLNNASIGLKNVVDIGFTHNSNIDNVVDTNKSGSGLFLFSRFIKNIPHSLKFFTTLISLIIISVKLLGYNFIGIYNDNNLLKGYIYIYGAVIITYLLFELYLLHIFYVRKTNISEMFPQFFINFLKQYERISESKILTLDVKKGIYINIAIYLFSILFVFLIL